MITAKLGEKIINCFNGELDKETLKKWSNKNILLCPVCGKSYEYCHGKVISPYFRHKDKTECLVKYSEPETDEHIKGKRILYEWLQSLNGISKLVLEGWLPETHQRPDIMFQINDEKYVIEFQCSPIATEYLERHELYQSAGINDIWILGTEKYNLDFKNKSRYKVIESYSVGYLRVSDKKAILKNNIILNKLKHKLIFLPEYIEIELNNIEISTLFNNLITVDNYITDFLEEDENKFNELSCINKINNENKLKIITIQNKVNDCVNKLNNIYGQVKRNCKFKYLAKNTDNYLCKVIFTCDITEDITFFIKNSIIDVCFQEEYNKAYYAWSSKKHTKTRRYCKDTKYSRIDTILYDNPDEICKNIWNYITIMLRNKIYK